MTPKLRPALLAQLCAVSFAALGFAACVSSTAQDGFTGTDAGGAQLGDDTGKTDAAAGKADSGNGSTLNGEGGVSAECKSGADCASQICTSNGTCAAATCNDGAKNGDETDVDCGGGTCPACDTLKGCSANSDCSSDVCKSGVCRTPSPGDSVRNGNETGVDCGGAGNPTCPTGQTCAVRTDCTSDVCSAGVCADGAGCNDGKKDGTETDIDCGGASCPSCATSKACTAGSDCQSDVCNVTCQAASYADGIKNGAETDIDCGGSGSSSTHACAAAATCVTDTDCASDGCDYTKHCAIRRSCVGTSPSGGHYGADTCGSGGAGSTGTQAWESCCTTVPVTVTEGSPSKTQTIAFDKYRVTAGRFRAFLEAVNYDVRDFVQSARTAGQVPTVPNPSSSNVAGQTLLDPAWDTYLPTSLEGDADETPDCDNGGWSTTGYSCTAGSTYSPVYTSVQKQLGDTIFKANSQPVVQGCSYSSPGTHMYYLGIPDDDGTTAQYDQSDYDERPLQCVDYLMAQAFCVWDGGGRLETVDEWAAAWGPGTMPWSSDTADKDGRGTAFSKLIPAAGTSSTYYGCRWPYANDSTIQGSGCPVIPDSTHTIELADYQYNYQYPSPVSDSVDFMTFIAAPGRTLGRSSTGAADIIGGLLEMTSDITGTGRTLSPFPTKNTAAPTVTWAGNGSWEVHNYSEKTAYPGAYGLTDKYGKQGLRCVHTN